MTTARGPAVGQAGTEGSAAAQAVSSPQRGFDAGPGWMRYLPPAVSLALAFWGISTPSYWRDEAATLAAIRRPFGDLISMLGHVDAVHAIYYAILWSVIRVAGTGELVLRFPSALAIGAATMAVAAIGRRLISPRAGLAAGLLFAVLPAVTRYGQEARSYALVIAVAATASYLLVRLIGAQPQRRRRWLVAYGVSLAALGVVNIFALLLVPAHAVTFALWYRRSAADTGRRRLAAGWLVTAVVSLAAASPLLVLGWRQRGQVSWLAVNKSSSGPGTLLTIIGPLLVTLLVAGLIVVGAAVSWQAGGQRRPAGWPALAELCLPWLILPPAVLLTASLVTPTYTTRYVLLCIPALALLGGAAAAGLGWIGGTVALLAIALAGLPTQLVQRAPYGHYDDIRALDRIVAARARPGDVVLYTNPNAESFGAAYPAGLGALRNIELRQGAIQSGTLAGTNVSVSELRRRLARVSRVWVVEINKLVLVPEVEGLSGRPVGAAFSGLPFRRTAIYRARGDWLLLFVRG